MTSNEPSQLSLLRLVGFCVTFYELVDNNVTQGVPTIRRAVINIKEKDDAKGKKGDKELLVEGYGLQKVMTTEGGKLQQIVMSSD